MKSEKELREIFTRYMKEKGLTYNFFNMEFDSGGMVRVTCSREVIERLLQDAAPTTDNLRSNYDHT